MTKEKVLITGASGSLAKRVILILPSNKYEVVCLTTNPKKVNNKSIFYWNVSRQEIDEEALKNCQHIIHLAGYNIMNSWTTKNRQLMYSSRVNAAQLLYERCLSLDVRPKTFITASAIGYYGHVEGHVCKESDFHGSGWLCDMCVDWEKAGQQFDTLGSRVVQMRISLLLSKQAGFLKPTTLSMKLGVAIVFGRGNQPFEWMHIDDVASFAKYAMETDSIFGPYNMASPQKYLQYAFMKALKQKIASYAIIVKLPSWFLEILFGKRREILEGGSAMSSQKLIDSAFSLKYPNLESVIKKEFNR